MFTTPEGATRPLLLGFVSNENATDGFDYGYDAENSDEVLPNDLSWMIDNKQYTTQGVGEFDETKMYPLSLFLTTNGSIELSLTELENFDETIPVYVYDSLLGTSFLLNSGNYQIDLEAGDYLDRYYISFQPTTLSVADEEIDNLVINYLNDSNTIYINTPNGLPINQVQLLNILGQTIYNWNVDDLPRSNSSNEIRIKTKQISQGNYIIKVKSNYGITNKKVIVK